MTPISADVAAVMLPRIKCHQITGDVASETGITVEELCGPRRTRDVARARQIVMYRAFNAGISLPEIGKYLGGRDHTTVPHGVRRVRAAIAAAEQGDPVCLPSGAGGRA